MSQITPLAPWDPAPVPTIETDRLTLRAHRISDLEPLAAMWALPDTARFIGMQTRSVQDIWKQIQSSIGGWALLGYGYWIVADRKTGAVIGEAGFLEGVRNISPSYSGTPEAGWVIAPEHWGKGYASETLTAMHAWSDARFPRKRSVCIIEPDHAVSIHLAKKFGYKPQYDADLDGDRIRIFERIGGQTPDAQQKEHSNGSQT